jgi:hypothetical protein
MGRKKKQPDATYTLKWKEDGKDCVKVWDVFMADRHPPDEAFPLITKFGVCGSWRRKD